MPLYEITDSDAVAYDPERFSRSNNVELAKIQSLDEVSQVLMDQIIAQLEKAAVDSHFAATQRKSPLTSELAGSNILRAANLRKRSGK